MEEWRPIPFPGWEKYEASNLGRIRHFRRQVPLKLDLSKHGYYQFSGRVNNVVKWMLVSRAVCAAFHGLPPEGRNLCLHSDDTPSNNHESNLVWGTSKENLNTPGFKAKVSAAVKSRAAKAREERNAA